ncbi:MAG: DUF4286 family protein [Gammaproteobacteria bacterium]
MASGSVVYEVNLVFDPVIEEQFDDWLRGHVREMLGLPGFIDATIARVEREDGRASRSIQYELQDRKALEQYLSDQAAGMRQAAVDRFGDQFSATRRILMDGHRVAASGTLGTCSNCETLLIGQYCAECGQRTGTRMISLWELIREASEFLTTFDSRLWRTLGLLMFRPGWLTRDYLLGRRARYIPPLRLFIAFSLMFFFLLAIGTRLGLDGSSIVTDGEGVNIQIGVDDPNPAEETVPALAGSEPADVSAPETTADATTDQTDAPALDDTAAEAGSDEDPCERLEVNIDVDWLRAWLTEERLKVTCRKVVVDHGASYAQALLENIPMMMFFFLPVMALVMKLSYPLSRRYYVEHLLFLVHFHAFFYFILTLNLLAEWTFEGNNLVDWPAPVLATVTMVYVPVYLFKSMRLVYGQSRMATLGKYALLGISYFVGLMIMFIITLTLTALTL